jgi:hypothetical protein
MFAILYKPDNAICEVENGICYMAYPTIAKAEKALNDYAINNPDFEIVTLPDGLKPHIKEAFYFVEGSEVSQSECLEYFILYSGFSRDDAIAEFNDNNNADSCDYINELCSDVEVFFK